MRVLVGAHAQDAHHLLGLVGKRFVDRLGEGRMVVGRVVVEEQYLVVRIGHHLGQRIEADGRPLVQIVAVTVVTAIQDDGEHAILACRYAPSRASSLRAAAYSISAGAALSSTFSHERRAAAALPAKAATPSWKSASVRRLGVSARARTSSSVALQAWSASSGAGHLPSAGMAIGSAGAPTSRPAVSR